MSANATLTAAGWVRVSGYFTHADSPDSKIVIVGRNWKHTAWGGAYHGGKFVGSDVIVGTGSSLKALRKHLGYWKRMLNMASGS